MGTSSDNRTRRLLPLLLLIFNGKLMAQGYKPVIIIHGLFDGPKQFMTLSQFITKVHPGTDVNVIDVYDDLASLRPMWQQVWGFSKAIYPIMQKAPDGVHLLCFSQGGLLCRALLSTIPDHNVHTFIALSSPLAGQFGDTDYLKWVCPKCLKRAIFQICYNRLGQKVSICDYWKDPHQKKRYLQGSTFLALLNGEKPHEMMEAWKKNFLRIRSLVLIGGPDDGVITPWQSSHFGFYDEDENVVMLRNQDYYIEDTFGLRTLEARGDVSICVFSGVNHTSWHSNFTVFNNCIEKWLI